MARVPWERLCQVRRHRPGHRGPKDWRYARQGCLHRLLSGANLRNIVSVWNFGGDLLGPNYSVVVKVVVVVVVVVVPVQG